MNDFKTGDFIRLKNVKSYKIDRVYGGTINIFEISNISPRFVEIKNCKEKIPYSEIEAIPINGLDDLQIYYDPIIAASFVRNGDPIPVRQVDKSYYLETFKTCNYQGETFYDLVKKRKLEYVNDVQEFLRTEFQKSELEIDAI